MPEPIARLAWTALDCADPRALAAFYSGLTGWPILESGSDDEWVQLDGGTGPTLCFQRVDDYRPPRWPGQEHPQQAHVDLWVDDLDEAEARALAVGARRHDTQPSPSWRVFLDPADHPFCLIVNTSAVVPPAP